MFLCSNVSSDGDSSPENGVKDDQTDGKAEKHDNMDENSENESSENDEGKHVEIMYNTIQTYCIVNMRGKLGNIVSCYCCFVLLGNEQTTKRSGNCAAH